MKTGMLAKRADLVAPHGSRIFAYRHFLSNQVLYSLSRSLDNNSTLKQLTSAGKKTIPRALRKDHWKPFFTVKFGLPHQGLKAFKKLREWRMLHELNWDPKHVGPLDRPLDRQKKQDEKREEVDELGGERIGGKRIRLSDWKLRKKKHIMNQAENSVADLATVLVEQEKQAIAFSIQIEEFNQQALEWIPKLATNEAARQERLESLNQRLADLGSRARTIKDESGKKWDLSRASKVRNINREIHLAKTEYHYIRTLPEKIQEAAVKGLAEEKSMEYAQILRDEISETMRSIQSPKRRRVDEELAKLNVGRNELLYAKSQADAGRPEQLDQLIADSEPAQTEDFLRNHDHPTIQRLIEEHNQTVDALKQQISQCRTDLFHAEHAIARDLDEQHRSLQAQARQLSDRRNALKVGIDTAEEDSQEHLKQELASVMQQYETVVEQISVIKHQISAKQSELDTTASPEQRSAREQARTGLEQALEQLRAAVQARDRTRSKLHTAKKNKSEQMTEEKRARIMQQASERIYKLAASLTRGNEVSEQVTWSALMKNMPSIEKRAKARFEEQQTLAIPGPDPVVAEGAEPVEDSGIVEETENVMNSESTKATPEIPETENVTNRERTKAPAEILESESITPVKDSGISEETENATDSESTKAPAEIPESESMTLEVPVKGYGTLAITRPLQELVSLSLDKIRNLMAGISLTPTKDMRNPTFGLALSPSDEMRLSDVSIEWANPLDAEYGSQWPSEVQHLPMGWSRNTAPADHHERKLELKYRYGYGKNNMLFQRDPETSAEHREERLRVAFMEKMMEKMMKRADSGMVGTQVEAPKHIRKPTAATTKSEDLARSKVFLRREAKRARLQQKRAKFIAKVEAGNPEKAQAIRRHWAKVEEVKAEKRAQYQSQVE
ncbi:hypothetical protein BDZ85DRAFT_317021 [Elsinoe ampelina]|uniref:Large ribosomal subunit protein mL67 n=1 Tax=Elsinoe ampelina TaxID=302913 RepID=A0A6A6GJH2_9PEZI|nr:hypothetical protein BDZ85DRAFT_317021 [Elsinoe ampelina]